MNTKIPEAPNPRKKNRPGIQQAFLFVFGTLFLAESTFFWLADSFSAIHDFVERNWNLLFVFGPPTMLIDGWEALKFFLPATAFIALGIFVILVSKNLVIKRYVIAFTLILWCFSGCVPVSIRV